MVTVILIGLVLGFVGSIPLAGPVAVLVFARALERRRRDAILIGWGCAIAEAAYAGLAFWGFSALMSEVTWLEPASQIVAAVVLLLVGVMLWRYELDPDQSSEEIPTTKGRRSLLIGFTITALNPTLIGTWAAVTTTLLGMGWVSLDPVNAIPFGLSVGVGIGGWYVVITALIFRYRERFKPQTLTKVMKVIAVLLVVGALWVAGKFFAHHVF